MPKTRTQQTVEEDGAQPAGILDHADALHRWAAETCHQHDRFARMSARTSDAAELRAATQLVRLCDATLCGMVQAYEKSCAQGRPERDEDWWHRANALWLACREYVRRHDGCDKASRGLERGSHTAERFGELQLDYELEASALLAVRQAAEAYQRARETAA